MTAVNIASDILHRQIREKRALGFQRTYHVTDPFIKRLGLEAELQGHSGCVNCLEWNERGDLLASGSDDQHAIVWDPLRHRKLITMHTGHAANIFSVKFLPHTGDRILVTGAADTKVHVHDLTAKETIHMFSDHTNRVKRIATAPMWPNTFWSAAEDGIIRQYDLRESSRRSEVLIDLTEYCGQLVEAKCLAVNPRDNNYLAVGANGPFVRLYDIRMIHNHRKAMSQRVTAGVHTFCEKQKPIPDGAGQYYVAGHLPVKLPDYNNRLRVLVATYVTFSPDGTELLVNMGGEQVYLFDLTFKQRPYTFLLPKKCHSGYRVNPRKFPEQAHSSACDALDKDIKAALFAKADASDDKKGGGSLRFHTFSRKPSIPEDEAVLRERSYDYKHRYCGHCNTTTDIKEANFFGSKGQYIVSGSDDGSFFIWEKETTNLVRILQGDESIVNCLQPHPSYCFLATSGIDPVVRLWNPRPESENGRVVEDMDGASQANQRRMNADPLEVMLLNMGYRITGLSSSGGPEGSDDEDTSEGQVQCRPS
uniref:WD and tetratricopeptide repeats 1 n=1 Tax=Scleropages formosus TaxID=113540 RepID=A0A8C9RF46_SCLFO